MNPDTGRFHHLESALEEQLAANRGWVSFLIGELVSIKGQQFRVVDIGQTHVVLRSRASEVDATPRKMTLDEKGGDGRAA